MVTHTDQKLELLKATPLLAELNRHELEEVGRLADEVDVPAGRVLMREGDSGQEFFVIIDGQVRIERGGNVLRTLGPGDFFGEIALVSEGPRTATATTETPAQLLVLAHREFHSLMGQFPTIQTSVLNCLATRLRRLEPEAGH
jgi:CRP-like cAMP-binding protein